MGRLFQTVDGRTIDFAYQSLDAHSTIDCDSSGDVTGGEKADKENNKVIKNTPPNVTCSKVLD